MLKKYFLNHFNKNHPPPPKYCEYCDFIDTSCNVTLEREANGTLSSPGYPGDYPNNAHCVTIIRAPVTNHVIQINVTFIEMESYENCSFDSLTIFSTEHPGKEFGTFAE